LAVVCWVGSCSPWKKANGKLVRNMLNPLAVIVAFRQQSHQKCSSIFAKSTGLKVLNQREFCEVPVLQSQLGHGECSKPVGIQCSSKVATAGLSLILLSGQSSRRTRSSKWKGRRHPDHAL
jgi:hypothetical protein